MEEKKEEDIGKDWVVCNGLGPTENVNVDEKDIQRGVAPTGKKKKNGSFFWRYLGWSSASTTPKPQLPDLADYCSNDDSVISQVEDGTARIYDSEMLASLQDAATQPLPQSPRSPPITPRNSTTSIDSATKEEELIKVESDKVFPVDEIKTPNQMFDYLDQLIETLQKEEKNQQVSAFPSQDEIVPIEDAEKQKVDEDEKRRETEELAAYLDQLVRELENDIATTVESPPDLLIPQVIVGDSVQSSTLESEPSLCTAWDGWDNFQLAVPSHCSDDNDISSGMPPLEKVSDSDTSSEMPPLVWSSEEEKQDEMDTDEIFGSREPLIPPPSPREEGPREEGGVDSKENLGWSDFNVEDYITHIPKAKALTVEMTEVVVESPQSPVSPALVVTTEVRHRRRRLFRGRRARPPTPYARRNSVKKQDVDSDEDDVFSGHSNEDDNTLPAVKRCKIETGDETLEVSAHTSDILNRLEHGEVLPEQDSIFNTVRVIRKRPAESPVREVMSETPEITPAQVRARLQARSTPPNQFQSLLDRLCSSETESDDDFDGSVSSSNTSSSEDEPVLQAICNEFAELAESVSKIFRRCQ